MHHFRLPTIGLRLRLAARRRRPLCLRTLCRRPLCLRALCLRALWLGALWLGATGCAGPVPADTADAGGVEDVVIGPCDASAIIYKISIDDEAVDLAEGATLPVTRGFQGFLFVRVGLKSTLVLPQTIKLKAHIEVPGEVDHVAVYATVRTESSAGGSFTTDVPIFFNDTPLAGLVGREATVELWTQSPGCLLRGSANVKLGAGVFMAEDASYWDSDVTP